MANNIKTKKVRCPKCKSTDVAGVFGKSTVYIDYFCNKCKHEFRVDYDGLKETKVTETNESAEPRKAIGPGSANIDPEPIRTIIEQTGWNPFGGKVGRHMTTRTVGNGEDSITFTTVSPMQISYDGFYMIKTDKTNKQLKDILLSYYSKNFQIFDDNNRGELNGFVICPNKDGYVAIKYDKAFYKLMDIVSLESQAKEFVVMFKTDVLWICRELFSKAGQLIEYRYLKGSDIEVKEWQIVPKTEGLSKIVKEKYGIDLNDAYGNIFNRINCEQWRKVISGSIVNKYVNNSEFSPEKRFKDYFPDLDHRTCGPLYEGFWYGGFAAPEVKEVEPLQIEKKKPKCRLKKLVSKLKNIVKKKGRK